MKCLEYVVFLGAVTFVAQATLPPCTNVHYLCTDYRVDVPRTCYYCQEECSRPPLPSIITLLTFSDECATIACVSEDRIPVAIILRSSRPECALPDGLFCISNPLKNPLDIIGK